jgi:DmsE family decaheme c-type cytochrome
MGGVIGAALLCLLLPSLAAGQAQPSPPGQVKAQAAAPAGEYAGEATCLTCHQGMEKGYHGSAHGRAWDTRTPMATRGCESCHGPGKAHADAGGDKSLIRTFKNLPAADQSASCTSCHNRGTHALWDGSQHEQRNVGCLSCHSVHEPKAERAQLKAASEQAVCATCHRDKTNKQSRFNHMPVREQKMQCSSCHNVHGSQNVRLLRAGTTVDESCASCHAEKRGPYLWEHAAVTENCATCHDPHGSNNDRMLVAKQPFLCQRCHVTSRHPPTVYEGFILRSTQNANKMFSRSCVICHQQIHGSNSPNGKAFLR